MQHAKDFMNICKVNSQTVEVIVPRLPAYAIDAPEEITLTIPAGSLTSRHPILASPSFQILTTVGSAFIDGPFLANLTQTAVDGYGQQLRVSLVSDQWSDSLLAGDGGAARAADVGALARGQGRK